MEEKRGIWTRIFLFPWSFIAKDSAQRFTAFFTMVNVVVLAATGYILYHNLQAVSQQNALTQTLGQPLCSITEVVIKRTDHPNEYEFTVSLKNFGHSTALDVFMNYRTFASIKDKDGVLQLGDLIGNLGGQAWPEGILLYPEQEHKHLLGFLNQKDMDKYVEGYKKNLRFCFFVDYRNELQAKTPKLWFIYVVTKLSGVKDRYDATLAGSGPVDEWNKAPLGFLRDRFPRGDITEEQWEQTKKDLKQSGVAPSQ